MTAMNSAKTPARCCNVCLKATGGFEMPREGAIIFRDLVGKLDVLNVECDKCNRFGRYHLDRLIERCGLDAKLFDWSDEITARKQVRDDYDARLLMLGSGSSEPNAGADEFGASIDRLLKAFTRLTNGCDGNVPCCICFGR
jgi:hypothetical protein